MRRPPPKPLPQFAHAPTLQHRSFEKLFIFSRPFNRFVSNSGKILLTALIWPRFVAPFRWHLTRYSMPLAGLDPAFAGYRILQLTDLHVGRTKESYLRGVLERCMREKPDLVSVAPRWTDQHHAMATAALSAGAHVISEKPFMRTPAEADEVLSLAGRSGRKIAVAHPRPSRPASAPPSAS